MTAVRYCVFEPKTPVMPEYQLPDSSCFGGVAAACWFGCCVVAVHCGRAGAACPGTGRGAFGAGIASLGRSGISGELEVALAPRTAVFAPPNPISLTLPQPAASAPSVMAAANPE